MQKIQYDQTLPHTSSDDKGADKKKIRNCTQLNTLHKKSMEEDFYEEDDTKNIENDTCNGDGICCFN